jgi:hypothetical protein
MASIDIFEAIRHVVTVHLATAGRRQIFEGTTRATAFEGLRPPVGRTFKVKDIAAAFEALERGGGFGKIVLTLSTVRTRPRRLGTSVTHNRH